MQYNYQCQYCEYSTRNRLQYIKHGRVHTTKLLKCPCCPLSLTISKFNRHFEAEHIIPEISANPQRQNVVFRCSNCQLKFHDFKNFKGHVRKMHLRLVDKLQKYTLTDQVFIKSQSIIWLKIHAMSFFESALLHL